MQNSAATTIWSRLSSGLSCFGPSLVVHGDVFDNMVVPHRFVWPSTGTLLFLPFFLSINKGGFVSFFFTAPITAKFCRYCSPPKESAIVKTAFISYCGVVCWGKMAGPRFREEGVSFITTVVADGYQHPWH